MNLNDINHTETLDVLKRLRLLDLEKVSNNEIFDLLTKLYKHIGVKHKLLKNRFVQRAVLLDGEPSDYFPMDVQRISYNPKGSSAGRANFEGESVFYASIATEIIEGYNCSALELIPRMDTGIRQYRIVIGNWLLQEDTEFVFIGGDSNLTYLSMEAKNRHNQLKDFVTSFKESALSLYAIDKFLCEEFSKEVPKEKPWLYKISAAYTSLLRQNGEKGLIYPSVKAAGAGLNLILFPDIVDEGLIKFERAVYGMYYVRDKEIINEYTMGASENCGKLIWHEVYHRLPGAIKDYYVGRSDYNRIANIPILNLDTEGKQAKIMK
ncbi:RES domain-containing protein [Pedobacter psychrodurus]|uniref:RES domain-containing protein n=1 Tax=Pedobacter psychrodurus TaxID=2530456 RepID=A0A4R0PL63_9SPHI|nr:RES family NAD+ phosphorylase [Pedobacter psychrodurus]TCD17616.1 RES domain-containing protein [Pedobacter psychrodurus]